MPIDPDSPQERIKFLLQDTGSQLLITQSHYIGSLSNVLNVCQCIVDVDAQDRVQESEQLLPTNVTPNNLAYVIYTSGTTGKPKGVMVEQEGIANFALSNRFFDYNNAGVIAGLSNYAFDGSCFDIFMSLLNGYTLALLEKDDVVDPERLSRKVDLYDIDTAFITTALFNTLVERDVFTGLGLKQVFFGGEAANPILLNQALSRAHNTQVVHVYGPTETIIFATYYPFEHKNYTEIPIGSPLSNKKLYVLDGSLSPVPIGVIGELYIGGAGLARGYLNQPELTEERFIANPFADQEACKKGDDRLYKTGDLVKWLSDGTIEYVGRNDFQVKIRGFRIELDEINQVLAKFTGIKQCLVVDQVWQQGTRQGSKYLVAYYVSEVPHSSEALAGFLAQHLPDYMVPTAFVHLTSLPMNANGKVDRKALPQPQGLIDNQAGNSEKSLPKTEIEQQLCDIWQAVLGVSELGIEDDFFRIGGDSILSIQLSSKLRAEGFDCNVKAIFDYRTISRLAKYLSSQSDQAVDIEVEDGVLTGDFGLLPIQRWFFEQTKQAIFCEPNHWNQFFFVKVPQLDLSQLKQALTELAAHHDMLRASFQIDQDRSFAL